MTLETLRLSVWPKSFVLFLTAQHPLPKSIIGDAENGSSGSGMTEGWRDAADPLAAIQVHHGARAPPACLIVQQTMPDCDPNAPLTNCSSVRKYSASLSVSARSRSSI